MQNRLQIVKPGFELAEMDDESLVAGLRRGDTQSTEYVVGQYAPALYRFAYYQLQDPHLAEEVVSEVMARMFENIDRYVFHTAPFRAWLFRIERNLIADHHRREGRRAHVSLERTLDAEPAREPGACDIRIDAVHDREVLRAALISLTGEQREVVLLHIIVGWELPEVAVLLEKSLASVKGLYYRGIDSMRRAID